MKKLMITTAAISLAASTGAFAGEKMEKSAKATTEAAMTQELTLTASDMSVKEILGEGIMGVSGERVARVDDILIGPDGKASHVVYLTGGVFGWGGAKGLIPFDQVSLSYKDRDEAYVSAAITEESASTAVEFKQEGFNDYRLASEVIGAKADLVSTEDDDDDAVVNDLILTAEGDIPFVVLQESVVGSIGAGKKYAVNYDLLGIEEGDGGIVINATEEQIESAPVLKSVYSARHHEAKTKMDD
ncbi:PRC-barrel domain-containing protein [Hyphococcus sp.]|uniref:PRC-barrel domain-containing protein n=1 Tax=Hyphococcus sp. TaxID=2038636 RepID=UPI0035C76338